MVGALIKLVAIIFLCLAMANLLVSLLEPVIETFIPEDRRKTVLFFDFLHHLYDYHNPADFEESSLSAFYAHTERKKVINEKPLF